jgi:magnesium chelatase subunit D
MTGADVWADAMRAAQLFCTHVVWFGGICLRAGPGPVRDRWLHRLQAALPEVPLRRVPPNVADDRLLGAIDLAATLQLGHPVYQQGLLAEARGGVLVLAMAERIPPATAARICRAMDAPTAHRVGVVALDEGVGPEERAPAALLDRLAFHVDLDGLSLRDIETRAPACSSAEPRLVTGDAALEGLCATAAALGIGSARAALLALRVAGAAAAQAGRAVIAEADLALAVRLVLAPRAVRLPVPEPAPEREAEASHAPGDDMAKDAASGEQPLQDVLVAAARAAVPDNLLARLSATELSGAPPKTTGRAGQMRTSSSHGRRIGCQRGNPNAGARLDLLETLKAALPWQRLRHPPAFAPAPRIPVRPHDFRIARFRQRAQTTTVFAVDASGSSALHRLAEAKGAVELLLDDCYVRRDQVALIGFRGRTATVLLPPTGSLLRARRCLAGLPGGGATPLAAGIDAAGALAEAERDKGRTPVIALLTDGRANVTRDGNGGRRQSEAEAMESGRRLRLAGHAVLLVDTSPRPSQFARSLADEMHARYLPLPYVDAVSLSRAIRAVPAG